MAVPRNFKDDPLSPRLGATDLFCKFFFTKKACHPLPGRQQPVAHLPMGDRGSFLKFLGTAIYF